MRRYTYIISYEGLWHQPDICHKCKVEIHGECVPTQVGRKCKCRRENVKGKSDLPRTESRLVLHNTVQCNKRPALCLECPVLVWRVSRHWLADVPHFHDLVTTKAEQVNGGNAGLAGAKHYLRVHCYKVAITEHILDH